MDKYDGSIPASVLLVGSVLSLFIVSAIAYLYKMQYSSKRKKVPPGSMGWPFVGHTLSWFYSMAKPGPLTFCQKHILPYGEIVTCNLFGRPCVVSVDPDFNKFVLQNEGRLFKASYFRSLHDLIGKYSMISVNGDLHGRLHGIAVSLLTNEKLRSNFMPATQIIFRETMAQWEGREIVLQHECKRLILNVITKHLLNVSTDIEIEEICHLMTDFINGVVSVPIEMLGRAYAKGLKARQSLIGKFYELIEKRREHPRNDLLSKLVNQENLPNDIVVDFLMLLLVASYETASRTMTIAIHFLTQSQKALEQLTDEHEIIRQCKGVEEKLEWQDYKRMEFTQCVVNETLRLSSVAMALVRETTEDVKTKDYVIPKGWGVMTFLGGVHLSEKHYENALKFDPWRWQGTDTEALNWKNYDKLFSPFGGGRRLCPGADLARLTISLFFHYFVTKFRWEVVKEDKITFFPITRMAGGLRVRIFARIQGGK